MQGHSTSGTDLRESRELSGQGLKYRLDDELHALLNDLGRTSADRTAKTLAKSDRLRVTLVRAKAGAKLDAQAAAGSASLHVLEGHIRVLASGATHELAPGEVLILSENLHEPVEVLEDSAFLVTVAWPEGAGAWAQEAAQGRL